MKRKNFWINYNLPWHDRNKYMNKDNKIKLYYLSRNHDSFICQWKCKIPISCCNWRPSGKQINKFAYNFLCVGKVFPISGDIYQAALFGKYRFANFLKRRWDINPVLINSLFKSSEEFKVTGKNNQEIYRYTAGIILSTVSIKKR